MGIDAQWRRLAEASLLPTEFRLLAGEMQKVRILTDPGAYTMPVTYTGTLELTATLS